MGRMDNTTVPIDLKGMVDKTGVFYSIGSSSCLRKTSCPWVRQSSEFDEREHYALVGVLILHQNPILERAGVCNMSGMDTQRWYIGAS